MDPKLKQHLEIHLSNPHINYIKHENDCHFGGHFEALFTSPVTSFRFASQSKGLSDDFYY